MAQEIRQQVYTEDFPEGWTVTFVQLRGYDSPDCYVEATNSLYSTVSVSTGKRCTEQDLSDLLQRVREVECPPISHAQWRNVGRARGWL